MASVSVKRTPGCPRNRQPALTAETNQDGFYDVDRLVRLFLRQPGQPLQGRVMDELSLSSTTDETRAFIGVVVALHLADCTSGQCDLKTDVFKTTRQID
ncbi:hypothetical protein PC129_g15671 [Phytophthora cactorum]|uniref:Uncharacterized protein n=1 Tax=Phytophthora cactorum TaxID=29920 RepID=A0A329SDC5_9STRA|nr:hypothetical protein Pcac1_g4456 [Phytophthora cactorum]KAG2855290.1 hypothetical protein PC113_g12569 [Phytophthora cactorum]KAG2889970.1 hypothetical protein PC114_g17686 [Phytophthora cactorum]KAG2915009.1 hypothetical protein PC117_g18156 [Phytophthora cactorum]KAG2971053.1 hypothetical protein PC118_g16503 [Phytophthora cactorum]